MSDLRTDFVDDILATSENGKRKFNIVDANGDVLYEGIHLEDVTNYLQVGDEYGADEINEQNTAINQINSDLAEKIGGFYEENITADTYSGFLALPNGLTKYNTWEQSGITQAELKNTQGFVLKFENNVSSYIYIFTEKGNILYATLNKSTGSLSRYGVVI